MAGNSNRVPFGFTRIKVGDKYHLVMHFAGTRTILNIGSVQEVDSAFLGWLATRYPPLKSYCLDYLEKLGVRVES